MKKLIIVAAIVLGLIAGVGAFMLQSNPVSAGEEFSLVREAGTVLYKSPGSDEYQDMESDEVLLAPGSFVKTKESAFARVFLPDNSLISLSENTEIEVAYEGNSVSINQLVGKTWNRVQSVSNGGEFVIETPSAIAAVRGTVFGVDVITEEETGVYVQEGDVSVKTFELNEDIKEILSEISVLADQHVDAGRGATELSIREITQEEKERTWFLRNREIDELYEMYIKEEPSQIRTRLMQKLSESEQRDELNFDSKEVDVQGIDIETLQKELAPVRDIVKVDETTCERNSSGDFMAAADLLNDYSENVRNYGQLNDFLTLMYEVCSDGQIMPEEHEKIQDASLRFSE